ncbi:hypothetical protein JCM3770_002973 [Rhodotorula araucariae]
MAESISSVVERILQNLPKGGNPWTLVRLALTAQVRPTLPHSFKAQLYTCSALIAATTTVLILCMVAKWRQNTYWLVRTHRGTGGTYIVVHYANAWSTMMILFLGILQGYIVQTIRYTSGEWTPNSDIWRTCVWFPGWVAFWLAAWSLRVSHVLHLDSSGRPSRAFYSQAWFVNGGAILIPSISAVAIALLAWQTHKRFTEAMNGFAFIDRALADAEATFTGTFDPALFQSGYGLSLAVAFTTSLASFGKYFRWVFWAYFIMTVLLETVLVLTAVFQLRELRTTTHDMRGRAHQSDEARAQEEMIENGYKGLLHITYAIVACCTAVNILFAYVAIAGRRVVYERSYSEVASLLPLWLFSVLGLPLSLLFLRRILRTASRTTAVPADQEAAAFTVVPVGADMPSKPSSLADKQVANAGHGEEYAMTSLASLASHRVLRSEEDSSLRQNSPALTVGSGAHLLPTPGGDRECGGPQIVSTAASICEQPLYSSYESRAPPSVEDGAQAVQGGGVWGSKKRVGGRK